MVLGMLLQLLHAYARRRRIHGYNNNNNNNIEVNVDDIVFYIPAQQQQKGLAVYYVLTI